LNLFKHPVAQGQRTLKTELRGFQAEMLAWVKGLSIKQRNQSFRGLRVPSGSRELAAEKEQKAFGEMLLWYGMGNCFIVRALGELRICAAHIPQSVKDSFACNNGQFKLKMPLLLTGPAQKPADF